MYKHTSTAKSNVEEKLYPSGPRPDRHGQQAAIRLWKKVVTLEKHLTKDKLHMIWHMVGYFLLLFVSKS